MEPDHIHYFAEPVKPGYSILRQDVVIDGQLVISQNLGSPAPTLVVQTYVVSRGADGKVVLP